MPGTGRSLPQLNVALLLPFASLGDLGAKSRADGQSTAPGQKLLFLPTPPKRS